MGQAAGDPWRTEKGEVAQRQIHLLPTFAKGQAAWARPPVPQKHICGECDTESRCSGSRVRGGAEDVPGTACGSYEAETVTSPRSHEKPKDEVFSLKRTL